MRRLLFVVASTAACTNGGATTIDITYDPCAPPSLTAGPSATELQLEGIAAAEALWRSHGAPTLGASTGGAVLEVRFQHAFGAFHGVYDDKASIIFINDDLTDPTSLAIVIAHEVGHAFGLVHVSADDRPSLMNPSNLTVAPTDDDQRALEKLWGVCE